MPDTAIRLSDKGLAIRLLLSLLLLNSMLALLVLYTVVDSRKGYEEKALLTTKNLVRMLDQSMSASVGKIDLVLLSAVHEFEQQLRERGRLDTARGNAFLLTHQKRLVELSSLRVADARGLVMLGDGVSASAQVSWVDRDFFGALRDQPGLGMVVTNPILGRVNNIWIISFVRRFNQPDGSFAGVVSASIPVTYLATLLSSMDVGPLGVALLRDASLGLIVRHPSLNLPSGAIGAKGYSKELADGIASGQKEFSYHSKQTADGVERSSSYRRMSSVPFHIVVGLGSDDYLAAWKVGAWWAVGALALFVLVTSLMAWQLWRSQVRRNQAAAEREQALSRMEKIASRVPGLVYQYLLRPDGSSSFPYASDAIRDIYRVSPDDVREDASKVFNNLHPDDLDAVAASIGQSASDLTPWLQEYRVKFGDGTVRWLLGNATPDRLDDGAVLWHGFITDITDRKEAEQAMHQKTLALERSNTELEQFAYVASHDLRQPLRMVTSYMQLLERALASKLDNETREMMHFAADGARRMDQMLVSLLEYSRVGRKGEPMQVMSSRAAVDEALHFLAPAIAQVQAVVRVSGEWPQIVASPDEFTRLWQNLIGNAVKFRAPQRPPDIDISVVAAPNQGGWIFSVSDNGIGINPTQFDRLFKVFQRLHARDQYEGNGIGLAVARKIVERHGGRIWVESGGAGLGSRFCFELRQAHEEKPQ